MFHDHVNVSIAGLAVDDVLSDQGHHIGCQQFLKVQLHVLQLGDGVHYFYAF